MCVHINTYIQTCTYYTYLCIYIYMYIRIYYICLLQYILTWSCIAKIRNQTTPQTDPGFPITACITALITLLSVGAPEAHTLRVVRSRVILKLALTADDVRIGVVLDYQHLSIGHDCTWLYMLCTATNSSIKYECDPIGNSAHVPGHYSLRTCPKRVVALKSSEGSMASRSLSAWLTQRHLQLPGHDSWNHHHPHPHPHTQSHGHDSQLANEFAQYKCVDISQSGNDGKKQNLQNCCVPVRLVDLILGPSSPSSIK